MPEEREEVSSFWGCCEVLPHSVVTCLASLCWCCPHRYSRQDRPPASSDSYANLLGARGQRLLSEFGGQEAAIEATSTSPPRLPHVERQERQPLLKGQGGVSIEESVATSGSRAAAAGAAAGGSRNSDKGSGGGGSDDGSRSSPVTKHHKSASGLPLGLDEEDLCPTCLEGYNEDNPKVLTACGHAFHLQCLYAWAERSQTCPVCSRKMDFEELFD